MQFNSSHLSFSVHKYKNWVQRERASKRCRLTAVYRQNRSSKRFPEPISLRICSQSEPNVFDHVTNIFQQLINAQIHSRRPHIFILVSIKYYFYPIYIKINKILFMSFVHIIITPRAMPAARQTHNSRCVVLNPPY